MSAASAAAICAVATTCPHPPRYGSTTARPGTRSPGACHPGVASLAALALAARPQRRRRPVRELRAVPPNSFPGAARGSSTVVRCRGPHPVGAEADAAAARGTRSRRQRRLPRAYAPSGCGHPARTPPRRLCWAGGGDSLDHEIDLLYSEDPARRLRRHLEIQSVHHGHRRVVHVGRRSRGGSRFRSTG